MRFLVDESLSPTLAKLLNDAGHDAIHARERGMQGAEDPAVMLMARGDSRVLVSADADFGALLTLGAERTPSLILFRGDFHPRASDQALVLLSYISEVTDDLEAGAIVVITGSKVRVRRL